MPGSEALSDFSALNPAEREVLTLLAQGHTAKSIATLIGKTEGAVNERLREARRKTGAASSRELARLFAETGTPKNRDEQSGVAQRPSSGISPSRTPARRARGAWIKGVFAMSLLGAFAFAIILVTQQQMPPGPEPSTDGSSVPGAAQQTGQWQRTTARPSVGRPSAEVVQADLRERDKHWSSTTEKEIRSRYLAIAGVRSRARFLRVTCGATICEVIGAIDDDTATLDAVQDPPLRDALNKIGLVPSSFMVEVPDKAQAPKGMRFIAYWQRI